MKPEVSAQPETGVLALRKVSYAFRSNRVLALAEIELSFKAGELCFLLGENGAGKSTLARICAGFLRPQRGYLTLNGRPYVVKSPLAALRQGVVLVPQHPDVVDKLTVWENIALAGYVPATKGLFGLLRPRELMNRYANLLKQFGLSVDLEAKASTLSAAEIHWLALAEALIRRPRFLILDEPTAPYTLEESEHLFAMLKRACRQGIGVIVITHKLPEISRHAERVVVLSQGRLQVELRAPDISEDRLEEIMREREGAADGDPGSAPTPHPNPVRFPKGPIVLSFSALDVKDDTEDYLRDLTFSIHAGEIVGILSPQGRAMSVLEDALCGMRQTPRGYIGFGANPYPRSGRQIRAAGIRYIPSRKYRRGIAEDLDIIDNLVGFRRHQAYRNGVWHQQGFLSFARYLEFAIPKTWLRRIRTLSGGTIQRIILNRELGEPTPPLVLCFEPSWGLDQVALRQMHDRLQALADLGSAILLVSSDQTEIAKLSHTAFVVEAGRLLRLPK